MTNSITMRVSCVQKNLFTLINSENIPDVPQTIEAKLKGKFFNLKLESPVVGDYVKVVLNEYGDAMIDQVLPRKTIFKRPNRSGHAEAYIKNLAEETMVSNFDYVFIMTSLNQDFNENRLDRYISIVLQSGAKPVIVLTKADLCDDSQLQEEITQSVFPKADVVAISSRTGYGIEKLKSYLQPEITIAFLGSSGVGKSTLVNTLFGQDIMKVSQIREADGKGRHTTTYRQLLKLPSGTWIMDTPGLREIGVSNVDEGLEETFSDITELFSQCRFNNCSHTCEPGCAVLSAISCGNISQERWNSYKKLFEENSISKMRMRQISMYNKIHNKHKPFGEGM